MTTKINIEVTNEPLRETGRFHARVTIGSLECGVSSARTDTPHIDDASSREVMRSIRANFNHKILKTVESLLPTE